MPSILELLPLIYPIFTVPVWIRITHTHLNSLEVWEEPECEGENSEIVVGDVQPLQQLQQQHLVRQRADLVVAQVQSPAQH